MEKGCGVAALSVLSSLLSSWLVVFMWIPDRHPHPSTPLQSCLSLCLHLCKQTAAHTGIQACLSIKLQGPFLHGSVLRLLWVQSLHAALVMCRPAQPSVFSHMNPDSLDMWQKLLTCTWSLVTSSVKPSRGVLRHPEQNLDSCLWLLYYFSHCCDQNK